MSESQVMSYLDAAHQRIADLERQLAEAVERCREQLQSWEGGTHPAVVTLQTEHNKALRQLRETQRRAQRYADRIDTIEEAGKMLAGECANVDASLGERTEAVRAWNAAIDAEEVKEKEAELR